MTAHELAHILLQGPDVQVAVLDEFGYNKLEIVEIKRLKRTPARSATEVDYYQPTIPDGSNSSEVVVLI